MDSEDSSSGYIDRAMRGTNKILTMPLVGNVDTVHLFLALGVVMISTIVWTRVLAHIKG